MRRDVINLIKKNKHIEALARKIQASLQASLQASVQRPPFFTLVKRVLSEVLLEEIKIFLARKTNLIRREDFPSFYLGKGIFFTNRYEAERTMTSLTVLAINQTFPFLKDLVGSVKEESKVYSIDEFTSLFKETDIKVLDDLKDKFNKHGSDKATIHNYYLVYGCVLNDTNSISSLMEIGLGTNNTDVASSMGTQGKPGASLRAFRDCLPNATIYGADVDKRILFEEERIKTFFVDQTQPETFEQLNSHIPNEFDLIIDDGLHSPNANIATLTYALSKLKDGGWCIVEDIIEDAIDIWHVVSAILPADTYESYIIKTKSAHMFVCQKRSN
jgi:hypothetical protein